MVSVHDSPNLIARICIPSVFPAICCLLLMYSNSFMYLVINCSLKFIPSLVKLDADEFLTLSYSAACFSSLFSVVVLFKLNSVSEINLISSLFFSVLSLSSVTPKPIISVYSISIPLLMERQTLTYNFVLINNTIVLYIIHQSGEHTCFHYFVKKAFTSLIKIQFKASKSCNTLKKVNLKSFMNGLSFIAFKNL